MINAAAEKLKHLMLAIFNTHLEEIGCDDCFDQVDAMAELVLMGKDGAVAMPEVSHHLEICKECREEFEALLSALKSI